MAAAIHDRCTCTVCTNVCVRIDQIFRVLDVYGWLLDTYVVDFFVDNLWHKLPECWKAPFLDTSPQEFGEWLAGDLSCKRVWPLSLLALRRTIDVLQINRDHNNPVNLQCHMSLMKTDVNVNVESAGESDVEKHENTDFLRTKSNNIFTKHVKKKKRYEIEEIGKLCATCAHQSKCRCIVDIGAGLGHLARVLAFQHGFNVTCIEQDPVLSDQARKCDKELLVAIRKYLQHFPDKQPQHISSKLEALTYTDLAKDISCVFRDHFNCDKETSRFGLIGLHPCGDLAATLLKLYSSCSETKFICIVGCCYMKLTLQTNSAILKGYPLSEYLSCKYHKLSYTALEVACHAIEKHCDKLKIGDCDDLIVHAYRAALETILIRKSKDLRHAQLRNVKVTGNMTFEELSDVCLLIVFWQILCDITCSFNEFHRYCAATTSHLEEHLRPQPSDVNNAEIAEFLNWWQQVVIFGSLRLMLAPLIETVVLLDRFIYLSEKKLGPLLKPVFDARLSPRNLVLISLKDNK